MVETAANVIVDSIKNNLSQSVVTSESISIIPSRTSYLLQYSGRLNHFMQSLNRDGIKGLIEDVFTPNGTYMTPDLKFAPVTAMLPIYIQSLLLNVPDIIIYASPSKQIAPRVITYQTVCCGTLVEKYDSKSPYMLWNQSAYTSIFIQESVLRV
jgi:hypothetical protein